MLHACTCVRMRAGLSIVGGGALRPQRRWCGRQSFVCRCLEPQVQCVPVHQLQSLLALDQGEKEEKVHESTHADGMAGCMGPHTHQHSEPANGGGTVSRADIPEMCRCCFFFRGVERTHTRTQCLHAGRGAAAGDIRIRTPIRAAHIRERTRVYWNRFMIICIARA
jgi:hypothetical protein